MRILRQKNEFGNTETTQLNRNANIWAFFFCKHECWRAGSRLPHTSSVSASPYAQASWLATDGGIFHRSTVEGAHRLTFVCARTLPPSLQTQACTQQPATLSRAQMLASPCTHFTLKHFRAQFKFVKHFSFGCIGGEKLFM